MQQPILHLRRTRGNARQKQYVLAMFYCRGGANKCLEEVQLTPRCNLLRVEKIAFEHGAMSSGHSTISRPHPAPKQYKRRVHTTCQHWAGSANDDINLFLVGGKNRSWQLHEGHDGRFAGLGSKIGPKPPPRYHWKSLIKGFRLV